ncbi:MAG: type II secretion system F family protein [Thermoplasmata archaeon]
MAVAGLAIAFACLAAIAADDLTGVVRRIQHRFERLIRSESVRVALAQAGLTSIPVPAWILARTGLAVAAAALAWAWFRLPVLGLIAFLVVYHLIGTALEFRRRGFEARHQEALLEAVRHGIAVMSRAGNATSMLEALADGGPFEVRPLFKEIVLACGSGPAGETFVRELERIRERVADPLFDDVVLALTLHWRQGGKLVPALEAVVSDWSETLRLQREAKALRSGIEASVVLLALLPFVFLVTLQLLAPTLLVPFQSPTGEVVFGLAIGWMALGYGILQRMSQPPRESRLRLREAVP